MSTPHPCADAYQNNNDVMFDFNTGPLPDGVVRAINQTSVRLSVCPSDSVEGTRSTATLLILETEKERETEIEGGGGGGAELQQ